MVIIMRKPMGRNDLTRPATLRSPHTLCLCPVNSERDLERRYASAARRAPNSARKKGGRSRERRKRRSGSTGDSGTWDHIVAQEVVARSSQRNVAEVTRELAEAAEAVA